MINAIKFSIKEIEASDQYFDHTGITKSRRALSLDNFGDYMVFDTSSNFVVFGFRFDADLDDVDRFLNPPK